MEHIVKRIKGKKWKDKDNFFFSMLRTETNHYCGDGNSEIWYWTKGTCLSKRIYIADLKFTAPSVGVSAPHGRGVFRQLVSWRLGFPFATARMWHSVPFLLLQWTTACLIAFEMVSKGGAAKRECRGGSNSVGAAYSQRAEFRVFKALELLMFIPDLNQSIPDPY